MNDSWLGDMLRVLRRGPAPNTTDLMGRLRRAGYPPPRDWRWDARAASNVARSWESKGWVSIERRQEGMFRLMHITLTPAGRGRLAVDDAREFERPDRWAS